MLGFDKIEGIVMGLEKRSNSCQHSHLDVAFEVRMCKFENKVED